METLNFLGRDGKSEISLKTTEYLDQALIQVSVNGKVHGQGQLIAADKCSYNIKKQCSASNSAGIVSTLSGIVALSQDKFEWALAAVDAKQHEIDNRSDVMRSRLISERKKLCEEIGFIVGAAHDQHIANIEHLSEHGFGLKNAVDYSAKESAARKRLADFDSKNPDVLGWINENKKKEIERNMWM